MKSKITIISMAVLLAAAVVSSVVFYLQRSSLQETVDRKEQEVAELSDEKARLVEEVTGLERKNRDTQKDLDQAGKELQELRAEIKDASIEQRGLEEAYEKKINELRSDIAQKSAVISGLEKEVVSLESRLDDAESANEGLQSRLAESKEEAGHKIQELEENLLHRDDLISELTKRIHKAKNKNKNLERKIEYLEHKNEAILEEFSSARAELEKALESKEDEIVQVREDLEACLERESAHGEKIRNLERSLERVQETKQEKETSLVSRIEKLTEGEEELRGRIQAQEETVSSMERRVESAARGKEALEEELAEKKQVLQDLQEHLSSVRREKEELQRSLADVRSRFKALVADLEEQVRQKGVTIEKLRGELTVTVVDKILFDSGRAELRHEGREVLQRLADVLKEAKQRSIRVVGHTDNVPIGPFLRHKFPTNWELSAARAASVVRFLDRYLDPDRMEAVGCSFYDAVTSNETPEGRAKNRRVEIMIAPRLEPSGPPS